MDLSNCFNQNISKEVESFKLCQSYILNITISLYIIHFYL